MMYSFINKLLPAPLMEHFTINAEFHGYNTRQRNNPHVNTRHSSAISKTFIHLGPKLWQGLPTDERNAKTIKCFTRRVRKFFIKEY